MNNGVCKHKNRLDGTVTSVGSAHTPTPALKKSFIELLAKKNPSPYCTCSGNYGGDHCEVDLCAHTICAAKYKCVAGRCVNDYCFNVNCVNGAFCEMGRCQCRPGFVGEFCEVDVCSIISCENGGLCHAGKCACINGFTGKQCEVDGCSKLQCANGGHCVFGKCTCPPGFSGLDCNVKGISAAIASNLTSVLTTAEEKMMQLNLQLSKIRGQKFAMISNIVKSNIDKFHKQSHTSKQQAKAQNAMPHIIGNPKEQDLITRTPDWKRAKTYNDEKLAYAKGHEIRDAQLKAADWVVSSSKEQLMKSLAMLNRPIPGVDADVAGMP